MLSVTKLCQCTFSEASAGSYDKVVRRKEPAPDNFLKVNKLFICV